MPARFDRLPRIVEMRTVDNAEVNKIRLVRRKHRTVVRSHLGNTELLCQCPCLLPTVRACADQRDLNILHLTQGNQCLPRDHSRADNCYLHLSALLAMRASVYPHCNYRLLIIAGYVGKEKGLPPK